MNGRAYTLDEVRRQTAALPHDLPVLSEAARAGAERAVRRTGPAGRVVLLGSGDSLFAAQASLRSFTGAGTGCVAMSATEFLTEFRYADGVRTVVVGVSASGGNPAVAAALRRARHDGRATVAVTGHPDSPVALAAGTSVVADPGPCAPSPGIRTHQASLLSLLHLAQALGGASAAPGDVAELARAQLRTIALAEASAGEVAGLLAPAPVVWVVAATGALGTARYLAAKLTETAGVPALAVEPEEWWHVHRFGHDAAHPVLFLLTPGPGRAAALETARRTAKRHRLIVIAEHGDDQARAAATVVVPVADGATGAARPLLDAVVAGPLALALARTLGRLPFARR
ncbi:SIS domain-containing protein [Streptomyces sp. UNOC14_S4]|uniref:SIS domain-containing protein n=1 Tax=Streptomyces sp. UNOC14_S4 TaxID=2872340 RepID=UPI001E322102|nr:SIS domain-containing protein [Streptomyces sp. UNOC14_S4]MCC3769507.1 SIS domain-containing protein [Streptomyces sp. UNOC14_S4]